MTTHSSVTTVTAVHQLHLRRPDLAQDLISRAEAARAHWRVPARLLPAGPGDQPYRVDADHVNSQALRRIVADHGWPGRSLVGDDGCQAAVEIAVHADHDPAFQRLLERMLKAAVLANDATPAQWAHLYDRCLARAGQPQLYGTQYRYHPDGRLEPHPMADPESVDDRRREVGLPPLAAQSARLRLHHTGSTSPRPVPGPPALRSTGGRA